MIGATGFCRTVGGAGEYLRGGGLCEGRRWRRGEGGAGQWGEGVRVGGILGHQGLIVEGGIPKLCQQAVLGVKLAVTGN